jgi:hypothetical protein
MTLPKKEEWSAHIRGQMAVKGITILDLTEALRTDSKKPKSPSYPTVRGWVRGEAPYEQMIRVESIVDNWEETK